MYTQTCTKANVHKMWSLEIEIEHRNFDLDKKIFQYFYLKTAVFFTQLEPCDPYACMYMYV